VQNMIPYRSRLRDANRFVASTTYLGKQIMESLLRQSIRPVNSGDVMKAAGRIVLSLGNPLYNEDSKSAADRFHHQLIGYATNISDFVVKMVRQLPAAAVEKDIAVALELAADFELQYIEAAQAQAMKSPKLAA